MNSMTTIAAYIEGNTMHMAADRQAVSGYTSYEIANGKIWRSGRMLVGASGSLRNIQLAPLVTHTGASHLSPIEYLIKHFVNPLQDAVKERGHIESDGDMGSTFLIAFLGGLYVIDGAFGVSAIRDTFHAIGSGRDAALGALYMAARGVRTITPERCLEIALEAAREFDVYTGYGVIDYETMPVQGDAKS